MQPVPAVAMFPLMIFPHWGASYRKHLLGEQLERSLDMLSKACSVMADYTLVHVMCAPAP